MLDPLRTLDIPLGGSVSPIDALGLLIEFLTIAGSATNQVKTISAYQDDTNGQETIDLLTRSYNITKRITGNSPEKSQGLHPIVYFYNERGKHSRFLFLGMTMLIAERVRNNDSGFFRKFTLARQVIEAFLIEYKSLVSILLQNWSKAQRVTKVRDLFSYLVSQHTSGKEITPEAAIAFLGVRGRVFDVNPAQTATHFSDTTKSALFVKTAISSALKCPICHGLLDPAKSVSYDHVQAVRDAGLGSIENGQLVHPYCNSARESLAA